MREVKILITIDNCCDCPNSHEEHIYTPDPFEHETGLYCRLIKETNKYHGAITDDKLIVADEWDIRKYAQIPEWCPMLKGSKP